MEKKKELDISYFIDLNEKLKLNLKEQKKQFLELQKKCDDLTKQLKVELTKSNSIREENELLLLQLRQMQEELEHYFTEYLKFKEQAQLETEEAKIIEPELTFDKIKLLENYVGPNNEHLYLQIENLQYGNEKFPIYEFKIGATQIDPEKFTEYGRLEFRELPDGKAPLKNWPPEESDQFGVKLVLDFDKEASVSQSHLNNKLFVSDLQMIIKLLNKVSVEFGHIDLKDVELNYNSDYWKKLTRKIMNNLTKYMETIYV